MSKNTPPKFGFADSLSDKAAIDRARNLLKSKGFIVSKPLSAIESKHTLQSLVLYFYKALNFYNPSRKVQHSYQESLDRKHVSGLVKSRENMGCSRAQAYEEAFRIIHAVIENERFLGLSSSISSTSILSQGWVIDRAIGILNSEDAATRELANDSFDVLLDSHVDSKEFQDICSQSLNKVYDKVVNKDGKKEGTD